MLVRALLLAAMIAFCLPAAAVQAQEENPIVTLVKSKVKDKTKPLAMTVTFKVKAGKEKEFEAALAPCLAATRKEPGCMAYHLNRDLEDTQVFVAFEKFKNVAALEEHAKNKHVEELLKKIGPLLEGAPTVKVYVPVAETHSP